MKNLDWKKWIIYLCIATAVVMLITSCHASRKNVSVNKSHLDSSVMEKKEAIHQNKMDSSSVKKEENNYEKITEIILQPVEVDSFPSVPGFIKIPSKTPGKEIIFLPKTTITEKGNIATTEETHVQKKADSTVKEQTATKVISDKKEVERHVEKSGFSWWSMLWSLCLLPLLLFLPGVRNLLKKIIWPVKL